MNLECLLNEINIEEDLHNNFNSSYTFFQKYIMNPECKPTFKDLPIYFEFEDDKAFWHMCSIDDISNGKDGREKYNVFPCTNHIANELCNIRCQSHSPSNNLSFQHHSGRAQCLYRSSQLPFMYFILKTYENDIDNDNIRVWKNEDKRKDKRKLNRWNILYNKNNFNYLIILQEYKKSNKLHSFRFITAYPLIMISEIKRLEKNYKDYHREKEKNA